MVLGACCCRAGDCTLPFDFCDQLSLRLLREEPMNITGANVALFTPKRLLVIRKKEDGTEAKREFCGLLIEWTPYGDTGESKSVGFLMKIVGAVCLWENGTLIDVVPESSVEWIDGKPTLSGVKIWIERNRPNQRPDGTSAKAPPSNPSQVAAVPHP